MGSGPLGPLPADACAVSWPRAFRERSVAGRLRFHGAQSETAPSTLGDALGHATAHPAEGRRLATAGRLPEAGQSRIVGGAARAAAAWRDLRSADKREWYPPDRGPSLLAPTPPRA